METKLEKINRLKTILGKFSKFFNEKFSEAKLNDGTVISFPDNEIKIGDTVMVQTEQGEMPLPDSSPETPYTLEDGTTFTVINGIVDNVVLKEESADESPKEIPPTSPAADMNAPTGAPVAPKRVIKSNVEEHVFSIEIEGIEPFKLDFSELFEAQKKEIEGLKEVNKKLAEKFEAQFNFNKELAVTIEMIADEPAAESVEKRKKATEKKYEEMTELEKYRHDKKYRN